MIVGSDAFMDMPISSQCLYFHLGMEADNRGTLNNVMSIARSIGATKKDIRVLLDKNYISYASDVYSIIEWDKLSGKAENAKKRITYEYRKWRERVLKRDGHRCQHCGEKEHLNVHHIKYFAEYKELRYELENGVTLCEACHKKLHSEERKNGKGKKHKTTTI